jgi:S1-C subfamily serine protease
MQKNSIRALLPLLLLVALLHAGASLHDKPRPLAGAEVYRRTLPAVAWVHASGSGKGTGWLLDRDRRFFVTCYHVVGENDTVEVFFPVRVAGMVQAEPLYYHQHRASLEKSKHLVRGRVLRHSKDTDLALIELDALPSDCTALRLASTGPAPGERVHVVGNRYDLGVLWGHTGGVVRQVKVLREGYFSGGRQLARGARVVVAQAPINEGDSGAPLVNERGGCVGGAGDRSVRRTGRGSRPGPHRAGAIGAGGTVFRQCVPPWAAFAGVGAGGVAGAKRTWIRA